MKVISIFSPKGGVGKTVLTLALSVALSRNLKVCTIEFDFSPGDFASILNVDIFSNIITVVNSNIDSLQKPQGENFYVIPGGFPETHERFSEEDIDRLLEKLESKFDIVIFDIQPGIVDRAIEALKKSDLILTIVEDTNVIAVRLARILTWLEKQGVDINKSFIILNKKRLFKKVVNFPHEILLTQIPHVRKLKTYRNKHIQKSLKKVASFVSENQNFSNPQIASFISNVLTKNNLV